MAKIKICGLRREEDIVYVNAYKPDYIGFVFAKGSKRYITKERAKELRAMLSPDIIPVGVFVNEEPDKVAEYVREGVIDVVQLHGDEEDAYIEKLRVSIPDTTIIKAIKVQSKEDVEKSLQSPADYLLFDSFSAKQQGGTGTTFDWTLLQDVMRPFFLAGGLHLENLNQALVNVKPYAIDMSSGVETDGYKDQMKIGKVIDEVKKGESLQELCE